MKKFAIGLALIVAIVAVAVTYLFSNLNGLVKTAIETYGSKIAGVTVKVESVDLHVTSGSGALHGLTIGNPDGFKSPTAVSVGDIALTIDVASIGKNPVVIRTITVDAPEVTYELDANGRSNFDQIEKNVATAGNQPVDTSASASQTAGPKLIIDRISIEGSKLTLATPLPGGVASAPLGDITLTNIGRDENGASASEVATKILNSISQEAIAKARSIGVGKLLDSMTGGAVLQGLLGKSSP